MTKDMNLTQLLEDWIGAEPKGDHEIAEGVRQYQDELKRTLPTLLAKIEQHVLEARKEELETLDASTNAENEFAYHMHGVIQQRVQVLDALLNTKGDK